MTKRTSCWEMRGIYATTWHQCGHPQWNGTGCANCLPLHISPYTRGLKLRKYEKRKHCMGRNKTQATCSTNVNCSQGRSRLHFVFALPRACDWLWSQFAQPVHPATCLPVHLPPYVGSMKSRKNEKCKPCIVRCKQPQLCVPWMGTVHKARADYICICTSRSNTVPPSCKKRKKACSHVKRSQDHSMYSWIAWSCWAPLKSWSDW